MKPAWSRVRLDECAEIVAGATPSTTVKSYWGGDVCWATPKDLSELKGTSIDDTPRKLTREGLASCAATVLPAGSVLFSSRAPIGHVAINTVPMATNQGFKSFIPKPERVVAKFLYWWLRANRRYLESLGNGVTFKEVSKAIVSRIEIPLPPLAEQRRIAAVLDKVDELRAKRRLGLGELENLALAVFLQLFGDPIRNTHDYPTSCLGELGRWSSGGTPPRSKTAYFKGEIPWFSSGELNAMFIRESKEHISREALSETAAKPVKRGSLLLGMYDTAALKAAIADIDCSCNQAVAFAELDSKRVETVYVYFAIVAGREHFRRLQRGVRQKNLNLSMVRDIQIPVPPIDEQQRFCRAIGQIGKLREKQRDALEEQDNLFHCVASRLLG